MPKASCSVCVHEKREEINRALVAGEPLRVIAGRVGTSKSALDRHKSSCLGAIERADVPAFVEVVPRPVGHGGTLAEQANDLRDEAMDLLRKAKTGIPLINRSTGEPVESKEGNGFAVIDFGASAQLIGRATALLELEAKLLGELQSGPAVTVQIQLGDGSAPDVPVPGLVAWVKRGLGALSPGERARFAEAAGNADAGPPRLS